MPAFLAPVNVSTTNNYLSAGANPAGSGSVRLGNGIGGSVTFRNAANSNDISAVYATSDDGVWLNSGGGNVFLSNGGAARLWVSSAGLTVIPGSNITTYGAGFKVGASSAELIGRWGSTPISQPANTVALDDVLANTGLRATGGIANFTNPVAVGTNPASTGSVRLPDAGAIWWRNNTNTGDTASIQGASGIIYFDQMNDAGYHEFRVGAAYTTSIRLGLSMATLFTNATVSEGKNLIFGATTGTKLGTNTLQKLSFWNATPIVQPANTVAIDDLLTNTGLRASGGISNFTSQISVGVNTALSGQIRLPNNSGLMWRNVANTADNASIAYTTSDRIHYGCASGHTWFNSGVQAMTHTAGGLDVAGYISTAGLTGATAASRLVGATATGAPASGTFVVGDTVIDRTGKIWVNTTAGSPGTWTQVGASSTSSSYWSDAKWGVD